MDHFMKRMSYQASKLVQNLIRPAVCADCLRFNLVKAASNVVHLLKLKNISFIF